MRKTPLFFALLAISPTALAGGDHCRRQENAKQTQVGAELKPFQAQHVSGPRAGARATPFGPGNHASGVMVWINDMPNAAITELAQRLDQQAGERATLVFINPKRLDSTELSEQLARWVREARLSKLAVSWVPNPEDPETADRYGIDPYATGALTGIAYRNRRSAGRIDQLPASAAGADRLLALIEPEARVSR